MSDVFFHPVEQAFLADWLGQERPVAARDIQLDDWIDAVAEGFIGPKTGTMGSEESSFDPVSNAVARLCLNGIQRVLPAWRSVAPDGTITCGRHFEPVIQRSATLVPRLILEINWAIGGPGITWPEAWYVTALPEFNRCVVTASIDSTDVWGWTDFALGHFAPAENLLDNSLRILTQYWRTHHGYRTDPFQTVTSAGLATAGDAWEAARTVWSQEVHP